jgi:hypothetical protein
LHRYSEESRREVLFEGVKEAEVIRGNWMDVHSGKKGTFAMQRAH